MRLSISGMLEAASVKSHGSAASTWVEPAQGL